MKNFLDASKFRGEKSAQNADWYFKNEYHKEIKDATSDFLSDIDDMSAINNISCSLIILFDEQEDELLFKIYPENRGINCKIKDLENFSDWFDEEWIIKV